MLDISLDSVASSARPSLISTKVQGARALIKATLGVVTRRLTHHRMFGHLDDDVWFSVNTTAYRRYAVLRQLLPSLPDPETQRAFIGSDGDRALREAFRVYQLIRHIMARCGRPVTGDTTILDFGCGWGRTIRFFMRDVPTSRLHGVDVMELAINLSRQTNPWCQFALISPLPPSNLPAGAFDLIYLYSVFSHLSEHAHDLWLTEFHRLLRPGGLLFATTFQRDYIERCEMARTGAQPWGAHMGSHRAFVETESWLARYDRGEYCHAPTGGGDALPSDYYGDTCISETYVRRRWSDRFEVLAYLEADGEWLYQNLIVAQRR